MSIYVSVACLGIDSELHSTIESCFNKALNSKDITMGIAFIGDRAFMDYILTCFRYKDFNIKSNYFPLDNNEGFVEARFLCSSFYSNEDYFLQIDSHTLFDKDWDVFYVNKFNRCKKFLNKDKVVFSGYPGDYFRFKEDGQDKIYKENFLSYPVFLKNQFILFDRTIPKFVDKLPWSISNELVQKLKDEFVPLGKVSGNFIFSDSNFIKDNMGHERGSFYWSELIIQSINLIDKNYTLVYPGLESKIYHQYYKPGCRQLLSDFKKDTTKMFEDEEKYYLNYIKSTANMVKIKKFEEYNNLCLLKGPFKENYFPLSFL